MAVILFPFSKGLSNANSPSSPDNSNNLLTRVMSVSLRSPTMDVTRRSDRTFYMAVLQAIIKPFKNFIIKPKKQFPAGSPQLKPPSSARKICNVKERKVEEVYFYDMTARTNPAQAATGKSKDEVKREKKLRL
jgi:hypothetical protein